MKFLRWMILLIVLAVFAGYAIPTAIILVRLHVNGKTAQEIVESLQKDFPKTKCYAAACTQRPVIRFSVQGVTDPAMQIEIQDWLTRFKTEHDLSVEIWLKWIDTPDAEGEPVIVKF